MSVIVISKNVVPILDMLFEVKVGDYVWMDWESIPKREYHNVVMNEEEICDDIKTPGDFNIYMAALSDTRPRKILNIYKRGENTPVDEGKYIIMELENVDDGTWTYEERNHLPWMYILKNFKND